jgi:hypothetical protein
VGLGEDLSDAEGLGYLALGAVVLYVVYKIYKGGNSIACTLGVGGSGCPDSSATAAIAAGGTDPSTGLPSDQTDASEGFLCQWIPFSVSLGLCGNTGGGTSSASTTDPGNGDTDVTNAVQDNSYSGAGASDGYAD